MPFKFNPFTRKLDITNTGGGGGGDVVGPASSADNNIAVFSGTSGKILKDTGISSVSPTFTGDVATTNLNLPQTTTTIGKVNMNGARYLHSGGDVSNTFCGSNSGNTVNTSVGSSGFGQSCLSGLSSGISNTCFGHFCADTLSTGSFVCAFGEGALFSSGGAVTGAVAIGWHTLLGSSGNYNVGLGYSVMTNGVSGTDNFGGGRASLSSLGSGNRNVALGALTGQNITTGSDNTILGYNCLAGTFATGSSNLVAGMGSGNSYTAAESSNILLSNPGVASENNTMRLGDSGSGAGQVNRAFVAGVSGVTVTGAAVLCDSSGQLGTVVSSKRYKTDIETLKHTEVLNLRPVTFKYKNDSKQEEQVGLIAEEVEQVIPRLCIYDLDGKLQSVKYHELCTYLLLEVQKLNARVTYLEENLIKLSAF